MTINVQSIKFDADAKQLEFTEKNVSKLDKFYDPVLSVDVKFSLLSDNANKPMKWQITGGESIASTIIPAHGYLIIGATSWSRYRSCTPHSSWLPRAASCC